MDLLLEVEDGGCDAVGPRPQDGRKILEDEFLALNMACGVATAWDDITGSELDAEKVAAARAEEIDYIHKMKLYEKVTIDGCYKKTGKGPISVRWIDINKGDAQSPNYRSRLVAREINTYKRDDLFAATPPLEALKMIISMAATGNRGEVIMVNDISRAFFHAKVTRDVYVQLPPRRRGLE